MLLAAVPAARAQATASEILGSLPVLSQDCTGPLGSLLPECQNRKSPINISNATPLEGAPPTASPTGEENVRIPSKHPAGEQKHLAAPHAIPEDATEFQRFAASSVGTMLPIFGANLFERVPTTFAPLDRVPVTADYVIGPGDEILLRVWGQINLDVALTVDRAGSIYVPQAGSIHVAGLQFQQLCGFVRVQLERVFRNFDLNVNMGQLRSIDILVVGQARRPGSYTVSSLSTLVNALFASGGPNSQGSLRRIQLKRGSQVVTELDLYDLLLQGDKSKDARLLPGDVVYIPGAGPQLAIAGSVRTPAIYEFRNEKTIGELVRLAGGISVVADGQRATLESIRDGSRREAIELRLDRAGLTTPAGDGDVLRVVPINPRFDNAVTLRGNVANPGRFSWRAGMRLRDIIPSKEALITREYWNKRNLLGFTPTDDGAPGEPADEAKRGPKHTEIASELPDINWSYALIERQSPRDLATELISFHPGKLLLENDNAENLELRLGDVVTIFSQGDMRVASMQQRRLVHLEGEFAKAGIYAVRPGETLGQVIERAGGLTPQAYLYGAEFVRESTRVDQQRRLDQFTQELQTQLEHAASNQLGKLNPGEDASLLALQMENQRSLIARMKTVKATGRVVLHLNPAGNDISKLSDLQLEDGDHFQVPPRPATVNVFGAVYNSNSFIHETGLRIADYLREAGGPTREADAGHMFVIRADGSVLPRQGAGPFSHSFESATLNPGDSIVVPETVFKAGFMHGVREWSQVVGQLALGAAFVNLLK